jgi:FMN-dependent NADH-azoreductase
MKLLHIDASALGAYSVSRELTQSVVARFRGAYSNLDVTYRDLTTLGLGHWSPVADPADPQAAQNKALVEEFLAADIVVIGAPMYNFSIPSQLKAWIDRITVAGVSFRYTANGPEGLAGGKRVIVVSSRGGAYGAQAPAAAMDFQEPYLRALFAFLGIEDVEFVRAEGLSMGDADHKKATIERAHAVVQALPLQVAA